MTWRGTVLVLTFAGVGALTWVLLHDSGITVAMAIAAVYVLLLSAKMPLEDWVRADHLHSIQNENEPIPLTSPCPLICGTTKRHVHFSEIIGIVYSERMCRAYGAIKLTDALGREIRHDWIKGIGAALILLAFWAVLSFAKLPSGGATTTPASTVSFDVLKAVLTALFGVYKLGTSAELILWFRKQNISI